MVSGEHNLPSPTMKQYNVNISDQSMSKNHISPTPHRFRSRRRKTTSAWPFSSLSLREYGIHNTNSPYYKGLTDQSLAIVDAIPSSCTQPQPQPQPHPHPHTPSTDLLSSPYYKGLTDYSLVIGPLTSHHHPSFSSTPSPYYAGLLTHYTLLLHAPSLQPPFTHFQPPIQTTEGITPPPNLKTDSTLKDLMVHADQVDFLIQETNQFGNYALEELGQRENDVDVEMVIEEKAWESVFEHKFEGVSEETIWDMRLTSDGVIEEKPLGEKASERREDAVEMDVWKEEEVKVCEERVRVFVSSEGDVYNYNYTWAAKHQPKTLEDFICNKDKAHQLKTMVKDGCGCSHFIFEGPPSVGKRSMIRAMLGEVFGADRVQVTEEYKNFILKGEMVDSVQVRVKKSLHHVEVNLSETKGYEKHVIVDLFKETYGQVIDNSQPCFPDNCKAIVLYEAEKLSIESLLYIKWLLEKYEGCNKVFFCCSDESKLQPVKPLCITIRLSSPSTQELAKILENIAKEEGIQLSRHLLDTIVLRSRNNLRQAIRSLEATCRNRDVLKDEDVILTGWEEDILDIAKNIIQEQSPRQLYAIRRKLRSLMSHDVPPDYIYKSLVPELTTLVHPSLRPGIAKLDREFMRPSETTKQHFCHAQNKQSESDDKNNDSTKRNTLTYLKLEEFIAKVMSWYKNWSEKDNKQ